LNEAVKYIGLSGREKMSVEFFSQAAIASLVVKNSCSLSTARLEFQVAKKRAD